MKEGYFLNSGLIVTIQYTTAPSSLRVSQWDPNCGNHPYSGQESVGMGTQRCQDIFWAVV